ncbi:MAG: MinD/ParA family protein, partial [Halobaculum sp.]
QPTIPSLSDALKVQEYARSYGTETAGVLFNKVHGDLGRVSDRAEEYFGGGTLATVPDSDVVREARDAGEPLLAHAPDSVAADAFREAASTLDPRPGAAAEVADRFRSAVVPEQP